MINSEKENHMSQIDYRARLTNKDGAAGADEIFGPNDSSNILQPLRQTNGVLFPYTPAVSTGSEAEYDQTSFVHSIYGYNAYIRSFPKTISITAEFTAQTIKEAYYMLSVLHFFRTVTKSYFGIQTYTKSGTPPPTLLFSYLGDYLFSNVPVIVKTFDYTLPADLDYVPVNTSSFAPGNVLVAPQSATAQTTKKGWTYVPTHLSVNLTMDPQYTPYTIRQNFNLDLFRSGKLMDQGWI
jgi:hypothetical protein